MRKLVVIGAGALGLLMFPVVSNAATIGSHSAAATTAPIMGVGGGTAYASYSKFITTQSTYTNGPVLATYGTCQTTSYTHVATGSDVALTPSTIGSGATASSVKDSVQATYGTSSVIMASIAKLQGVNILGGLIKANSMTAESNTTANSKSASSNANGTTISGLTVSGKSQTVHPNETLPLTGIGTVTIDEQSKPTSGNSSRENVILIDIHVQQTNKTLGLKAGSQITIGRASSNYTLTFKPDLVGANSYGYNSTSGSAKNASFNSGPQALATIPCTGGSNENVLSKVTTSQGSTAAIDDTARGNLTSNGSTASATSQVKSPGLPAALGSSLGSVITANSIRVTANAGYNGSTPSHSFGFAENGLKVNGKSVSAVPVNDRIPLQGIGYVVLNQQTVTSTSTSVTASINAIDLVVTKTNTAGLPVGSRVIYGHADATARQAFLVKP